MSKIAITGLNGVIGQILAQELSPQDQIFDLYHKKKFIGTNLKIKHIKFNLLDKTQVRDVLDKINPDVIIHLAAVTHIDKCEKDKKNGEHGIVWRTNVVGTQLIAEYCAENGAHMIFLSTECVFDGKKRFFDEKSKKNPINWYGLTKDEAEEAVTISKAKAAILRSVVTYNHNDNGKTIFGKILKDLKSGKTIGAVGDQNITPTNTFDIVKAIMIISKKRLSGIYHVAPRKSITPYEMAKLIAKKYNYPTSRIKKNTLISFYGKERASLRLKNASLSGRKSEKKLNFTPLHPKEAL